MTLTTRANLIEYCNPNIIDLRFATVDDMNVFLDRLIVSTSARVLSHLRRNTLPSEFAAHVENIVLRMIQVELALNVAMKSSAITTFDDLKTHRHDAKIKTQEIMEELQPYILVHPISFYQRVSYG